MLLMVFFLSIKNGHMFYLIEFLPSAQGNLSIPSGFNKRKLSFKKF